MSCLGECTVDGSRGLTRNLMLRGATAEEKEYPSHAVRLPCSRLTKGIPWITQTPSSNTESG